MVAEMEKGDFSEDFISKKTKQFVAATAGTCKNFLMSASFKCIFD
jgi:hypothetical protein